MYSFFHRFIQYGPELCQIVYNLPAFKGFLPLLNNLPLPNVSQGLISQLDGFQLVPKHISVRGKQRSQPLKQNNIAVNQKTSSSRRNLSKLEDQNILTSANQETPTNKEKLKEFTKRSKELTSSPATTSRTVTNDWVNDIRTISSLLNRGNLNSRMNPCTLAVSRGHKNAAPTAPSGVLSAIEQIQSK